MTENISTSLFTPANRVSSSKWLNFLISMQADPQKQRYPHSWSDAGVSGSSPSSAFLIALTWVTRFEKGWLSMKYFGKALVAPPVCNSNSWPVPLWSPATTARSPPPRGHRVQVPGGLIKALKDATETTATQTHAINFIVFPSLATLWNIFSCCYG